MEIEAGTGLLLTTSDGLPRVKFCEEKAKDPVQDFLQPTVDNFAPGYLSIILLFLVFMPGFP